MPVVKPPSPANLNRLIRAQLERQSKGGVDRDEFDKLSQNVEKLAEDLGQVAHNADAVRDYVKTLTDDVKAGRSARFWLSGIAVLMVLSAMSTFLYLIVCPLGQASFSKIPDTHLKIAVVIALFGLSFGLLALLIKGAYHRGQTTQVPDVMQDHVKLFFEAIKGDPFKSS